MPRSHRDGAGELGLDIPKVRVDVDVDNETEALARDALAAGALPGPIAEAILKELGLSLPARVAGAASTSDAAERLGLAATRVAQAVHEALFDVEPLSELEFRLSKRAKWILALGWEAIVRLGRFPVAPDGPGRMRRISRRPCGVFHFVSASDGDRGFYYTLGIAQSPEAQAERSLDVPFGLDGELIVPGQAVSPIPPLLALATRLFAAGIPTSSNISEEQHSIPARAFPRPAAYGDLEPIRPGQTNRQPATGDGAAAIDDVVGQLGQSDGGFEVDALLDVTGLDPVRAEAFARAVLGNRAVREAAAALQRRLDAARVERRIAIALFLNVEHTSDRVRATQTVVEVAERLGLRHVAVSDDEEDPWLPNLNEYFTAEQLNAVADHADSRNVCVIDARPLDPEYTASTACQRIQSVMTSLAVDILKLGMWLCLDARAARRVWERIRGTPAFGAQMVLMPIGIVEPWSAFVDNRQPGKTARAIADPFAKIRFMIEEARELGMPSLLTDTRHKETWLLLGAKAGDLEPHPRETGHATSLLSWDEFMQCERLARASGVFLGQAGSVEMSQMFRVISDTTLDAAREGRNPATAIWTAETERVIRRPKTSETDVGLHRERSADVSPFLAVVNRAEESHARLDGWLRFLEEAKGPSRSRADLRRELDRLRSDVLEEQDALVVAESALDGTADAQRRIREAWRAYRKKFLAYHAGVRERFVAVRNELEEVWKRKEVRS